MMTLTVTWLLTSRLRVTHDMGKIRLNYKLSGALFLDLWTCITHIIDGQTDGRTPDGRTKRQGAIRN